MALTLNKNDIWKFGTISATPFDWLEASYFYYRPEDLIWEGNGISGHYLDKGFNVKFIYRPKSENIPNIAIGLDDFAGTGYFTREYVVSTMDLGNSKVSIGMGWGKFAGENSFKNPLSNLKKSLLNRPTVSDNTGRGGNPSYDQWFRGNSSLFGGVEYSIQKFKGLKFKLEYDPFNYFDFSANNRIDASKDLRKKENNINVGLSYPINDFFTIDASYIKGNAFNLNFTLAITFDKNLYSKPKFHPKLVTRDNKTKSKQVFYEDLLNNLNNNNLLLQTASLNTQEKLDISISTSDHRNAIRSASYVSYIAKKVANNNEIKLSTINISHINAGIELNNITFIASHLEKSIQVPQEVKRYYTSLDSGDPDGYKKDEFQPSVSFPVIFTSLSPSLITHIGNPEKFYYGGLILKHTNEIQFSRNLILSSELNYSLYNNITDTISGSSSQMEHVRTDIVQYLKEDDLYITRMQLDYIWSPRKDIYAKFTGGILESMFGGIGGEILYAPFNNNFSFGLELFHVKQRAFSQKFNFNSYKTTTGHLTSTYSFPIGIEANLSYGRYLAKDDGFTLDLARRSPSGFKAGIYFTKTNVSEELFGEGSFDKGFYFQIPMDLLSGSYKGNYSTFKISPLTRDGGAKLIHEKQLKGLIYNSNLNVLKNQWDGFLN